jgi:3-mercaptopyruvate sulfurtransferase SseA
MAACRRGRRRVAISPRKPRGSCPASWTLAPQSDVIAGLDYVKNNLHTAGVRIVDARDPKVYSGENERAGVSAGHIEGAANVYYDNLHSSMEPS